MFCTILRNKNFRERERVKSKNLFEEIISLENLFLAWKEFKKGKTKKYDVCQFTQHLRENIVKLNQDLENKSYQHSRYQSFYIKDPKLRHIHKACVRDRVLHHAIFRMLYPIFDKHFIFDSYSCRNQKGTHKAVKRLNNFARKVSANNSKKCFFLKCDIKKFFDSIDQDILISLIEKKVKDGNTLWLIKKVIKSFHKGLPLGNITSQLFANVYLNELDQFIKHNLKAKYYIRYCDDFIIAEDCPENFSNYLESISNFLRDKLKLSLHSDKIIVRRYNQGIDFLGYVSFPHHIVLRPKTGKRVLRKVSIRTRELKENKLLEKCFNQILHSYFGMLKHCQGYNIKRKILNLLK